MQEERLVWFTSRSYTPFVWAEKVSSEVTQISGDYTFNRTLVDTCTELEIKEVGTHPPEPNMGGAYDVFFVHGALCNEIAIVVTFQAVKLGSGPDGESVYHILFNFSMEHNSRYNQLQLAYGCEKGEGFYGFGAQYSRLNMRGKVLPMFLSEQGVGRGLEPVTLFLDAISSGAGK